MFCETGVNHLGLSMQYLKDSLSREILKFWQIGDGARKNSIFFYIEVYDSFIENTLTCYWDLEYLSWPVRTVSKFHMDNQPKDRSWKHIWTSSHSVSLHKLFHVWTNWSVRGQIFNISIHFWPKIIFNNMGSNSNELIRDGIVEQS